MQLGTSNKNRKQLRMRQQMLLEQYQALQCSGGVLHSELL